MQVKSLFFVLALSLAPLPIFAQSGGTPELLSNIPGAVHLDKETQSGIRGQQFSSRAAGLRWCKQRIGKVSRNIACSTWQSDRETWISVHLFIDRRGNSRSVVRAY